MTDAPPSKKSIAITLLFIGLIALIVRAVFVVAVIQISANEFHPLEGSDAPEYLHLARNFATHGRYVNADARSRLTGLYRTPIYPLYCAAIMRLGGGNRTIIWSQVPMGAAICVLTAWLAIALFRSIWLAWLVGMLAALSPTGVGLTAMILVEVPFEVVMVAGFCLMLIAATNGKSSAAVCAGACWAIAGLIKPTLMLWPIFGILVWILIARAQAQPIRWRQVIVCSAMQAIALLAWSARNYVVEDYFSPSAVGARNLRLLVVPLMEEWLKLGRQPTRAEYYVNYREVTNRQRLYLNRVDASASKLVRDEMHESSAMIRSHPWMALRVYCFNMSDELITGWDLLDRRLYYDFSHAPRPAAAPAPVNRRNATTRARQTAVAQQRRQQHDAAIAEAERLRASEPLIWKLFQPLSWITNSRACQWLWAIATAASVLTLLLVPRHARGAEWHRRTLFVAALWITLLYFAAFAGTIFRGGSRLMYPAEFAVILLICSNIPNLRDMIRGARRLPRAE